MIAQSVLDEVKAWALTVGFEDTTAEHTLNALVLEKDIDGSTLQVWIRYPEREDELLWVDYSQGYEESIRLAEVHTLVQVREIYFVFTDALTKIKTITQLQSANAETLRPSLTAEKSTDV